MSFGQSIAYAASGYYEGTDGDDLIVAIGLGGDIIAGAGDDDIVLGSLAATVYAGSGDDTITGASGILKVYDTGGDLTVNGLAAYSSVKKNDSGDVVFNGVSGYNTITLSSSVGFSEPQPDAWQQLWTAIGEQIDAFISDVGDFFNEVGNAIDTAIDVLREVPIFDEVISFAEDTWKGVTEAANAVADAAEEAVAWISGAATDAWNAISDVGAFFLDPDVTKSNLQYQASGSSVWVNSAETVLGSETYGTHSYDWQWADELTYNGSSISLDEISFFDFAPPRTASQSLQS